VLGAGVSLQDGSEIHGRVRLGDRVVVQKCAEIVGNVEVGQDAVIGSYSYVSTMPEAYIRIGERVLVNSFNVIGAGERVLIGDDCIFAAYVQITDSSHRFEHIEDSPRHDPGFSKAVTMGRGVWLGSGVKVLMGVQIGEGVVVGAGAVVNRSLPGMSIAVGMPAKVVRLRTERNLKETGTI
jgi:acetyltransferase-like isoleucine patch superfamily enzyme